MVLVLIFISIFSLQNSENLFSQYEDEINKQISKSLDLQDYDLHPKDYEHGELKLVQMGDRSYGYVLVAEVASCHLGGCSFVDSSKLAESEYFDLLVILDAQFEIQYLDILDYFSDYGYEVTSRTYLKKFVGMSPCEFGEGRDDIDAVSGATISSYALEGSLSLLCSVFN